MKYNKNSLFYDQQADLLIERGLEADRSELIRKLYTVNYYRLSGYWYPFLRTDNTFLPGTTLEKIWRRYTFDRRLRLLTLDAIERVEIAIRTEIVYRMGHAVGPFGYMESRNLPNLSKDKHDKLLQTIRKEAGRSHETFINHFNWKYGDHHELPPIWMVTELMSFGTMLTLFRGIPTSMKQKIAERLRIADRVLESWLTALNGARNICAHHCRLWNRVFGYKPMIPREKKYPEWHNPVKIDEKRVFGILTILKYAINRVAPQSGWQSRLEVLFEEYTDIPIHFMGFPDNWKDCSIWNNDRQQGRRK